MNLFVVFSAALLIMVLSSADTAAPTNDLHTFIEQIKKSVKSVTDGGVKEINTARKVMYNGRITQEQNWGNENVQVLAEAAQKEIDHLKHESAAVECFSSQENKFHETKAKAEEDVEVKVILDAFEEKHKSSLAKIQAVYDKILAAITEIEKCENEKCAIKAEKGLLNQLMDVKKIVEGIVRLGLNDVGFVIPDAVDYNRNILRELKIAFDGIISDIKQCVSSY